MKYNEFGNGRMKYNEFGNGRMKYREFRNERMKYFFSMNLQSALADLSFETTALAVGGRDIS